ncbi:hypothetical protein [Labedaea rhizosphaerae]|uniref:Uncharacterized protein n=1 Tax=Labedaea rhizosphaerae TaxID=598644 RepID=A0A4R6SJ31_LABRH|nr:hypothetical protein [Labedaea rhizosphaerae]TDQ00929.1 hypothetical protein EV186_102795 [Labedaea rhizosphaerae]
MNDLKALEDAFAELERRADNAVLRAGASKSRRPRLVPVAAAVLVAGGLVAGVAVLTGGSGPGGSSSVREGSPSTPMTTLPVRHSLIPTSAKELEDRFRVVLGDTATFTVTDTGGSVETDGDGNVKPGSGVAIVGVLTVAGHSGGYDLQIIKSNPAVGPHCEDLDRANCNIHKRPDGSSIAVSTEPLAGPGNGVTHMIDLVRKDGVEVLMHVSNERDPKGESQILSPKPPLSTDQMIKIVTSPQW